MGILKKLDSLFWFFSIIVPEIDMPIEKAPPIRCFVPLVVALLVLMSCTTTDPATNNDDAVLGMEPEPARLFLIGDSTMSTKIPERAPETGWGMALEDLAKPSLDVENHAVNGRSTKSFRDEGRWQVVLDQLNQGDFVLIQFGHNDEKEKDPTRYAAPWTDYADNLGRYVSEARERGAVPLLATPICRRHFDAKGQLESTHGDYPDAARKVAEKMQVTLIDLQKSTCQSLSDMGPGPSTELFLHVKPGEYAYYKDGKIDNTHLSPKGALWVARMAVAQLQNHGHALAAYFHKGVPEIPGMDKAVKLWSGTPPVEAKVAGKERTEDNRVYNVREPEIIPRLAPAGKATGVGVVVFPGGGYHRLAIDKEGIAVANWLNNQGIHAFIVKYRMKEFGAPAPLLDAQQAVRLVRSRSKEWRVHPEKVGVIGFSAGGHLAASLLAHYDWWPESLASSNIAQYSARPNFGILIYPVITLRKPYAHEGSRIALVGEEPTEQALSFYSIEEQVGADMPPVFLVHGGDDESVPVQNSLGFYHAAHRAGVPVEMLLYNKAPHGFGLQAGYQQASRWPDRALEWLESINMIKGH